MWNFFKRKKVCDHKWDILISKDIIEYNDTFFDNFLLTFQYSANNSSISKAITENQKRIIGHYCILKCEKCGEIKELKTYF